MTEPREVVWSDERIRKEAMSDEYAIGLAVTIRDDLRATIDAQAQEIAELRAQVQEAGQWVPPEILSIIEVWRNHYACKSVELKQSSPNNINALHWWMEVQVIDDWLSQQRKLKEGEDNE